MCQLTFSLVACSVTAKTKNSNDLTKCNTHIHPQGPLFSGPAANMETSCPLRTLVERRRTFYPPVLDAAAFHVARRPHRQKACRIRVGEPSTARRPSASSRARALATGPAQTSDDRSVRVTVQGRRPFKVSDFRPFLIWSFSLPAWTTEASCSTSNSQLTDAQNMLTLSKDVKRD